MRINNFGSIVFSMMLVVVLVILGASIMLRSVNEHNIAMRTAKSVQALWLADAGVQNSIYDIANNSCHGFVQQGTSTACTNCSSCGGGNKTMAVSMSGAGDYDIVLNSANTSLTSIGSHPSRSSASKVQRQIQATLGVTSPFTYAAFAKGQVTLSNNTFVDSYDSSVGAYSVANSATNGDVGSNGTTANIITINNNASVGGDVSTGPSGTVSVGSGVAITGTQTHTNNVILPSVVVPTTLSSLASGGTLSLANNA